MKYAHNEKQDIKDFIKIASELKNVNQNIYECYKNRMIGALEIYKVLKNKN